MRERERFWAGEPREFGTHGGKMKRLGRTKHNSEVWAGDKRKELSRSNS